MKDKNNYNYDILVIGAGHAGIEAGLSASRLGCKVAVFTINLDSIGNCPCNPSIGGTAKGHIVCEIDALGGEMGRTTDECFLQSRMLNLGKGAAVHSLRAQIDRNRYKEIMKYKLEKQDNLDIKQAEIISIHKNGDLWELTSRTNVNYISKCVILATGTYLNGCIHIGEMSYESGPDGIFPSVYLSKSLEKLGLKMLRFKTGTPARALKSSIDYSVLEKQEGDKEITPFSKDTKGELKNKISCYITWTNEKTKNIILANLHRSSMYSGKIDGTGARYCPSIEDKIIRFSDKERHQVFVEPSGLSTEEIYLQGLSTSLPEDVQIQMYRSIKGFENIKILRPAYAIEYDLADPSQMDLTLEFKNLPGLFGAGQFNGSSGYEEAAAQGLIAGINAALKIKGQEKLVLDRGTSYIGTLVDDLVTKGTSEPYRMMTSRSEFRLILRQDNADERLTPIGRKIGLITDYRWKTFLENKELKNQELKRVNNTVLEPSKNLNNAIVSRETSPINFPTKIVDLLKRPTIDYKLLTSFDESRPNLPNDIFKKVQTEIKYEGYIKKQELQIKEMRRLEEKKLPKDFDYSKIKGLRLEAIEKLLKIKPENIGRASRISGVNPADISVLMIWLTLNERKGREN